MRLRQKGHVAPYVNQLGVNISKVKKGYCQCVLEVDDKLLNVHPALQGGVDKTLHGAVISILADTSMGYAMASSLGENEIPRTLEIKVSYFAAVTSGVLTCESKIVHKSKTFAALESEIANNGRLIAKATATFGIAKAK